MTVDARTDTSDGDGRKRTTGGPPQVSVLMSVHNGKRFLPEAVDSILAQDFRDFEFVVVDDGSTDDTSAILASYADHRVVRLHNPIRLGLAASLNRLLGVARGEYVARQDADDMSYPTRLSRQVGFLDSHPFVGIVGSWREQIDGQGCTLDVRKLPCDDLGIRVHLPWGGPFTHGSVMVRAALLHRLHGYREMFDTSQDYDLWLRLAECTQLANLPEALYRIPCPQRACK